MSSAGGGGGGGVPSTETNLPKTPLILSSFSFRHLLALAIATILAATGTVSIGSIAFVLLSLGYTYFLSVTTFPVLPPPAFGNKNKPSPPVINNKSNLFRIYALFSAVIGLLLPIAYIIECIIGGDKEGIKSAAPHLFLLCSQVFMEGLFYSGRFSLPIWVFVPVLNNSARIFTLIEWVNSEISKVHEGYDYEGNVRRLYFGIGLACVNLGFWCYNLFGFLLPVFLPRAFKRYYYTYHVKEG
ncbi:hypothetical protein LguiB_029086 [Lonicera macranthoides]